MRTFRIKKIVFRPIAQHKGSRACSDDFYSLLHMREIKEGFEQIKNGECMSHDEMKRFFGL